MKVILDSHTFLWMDDHPEKLSPTAWAICQDRTNVLILSVASVWEIQIKTQIGKLKLSMPLSDMIEGQQKESGLEVLPISHMHVFHLEKLPYLHRDPFDRIIVAQCEVENATLISHDAIMSKYTDRVIW